MPTPAITQSAPQITPQPARPQATDAIVDRLALIARDYTLPALVSAGDHPWMSDPTTRVAVETQVAQLATSLHEDNMAGILNAGAELHNLGVVPLSGLSALHAYVTTQRQRLGLPGSRSQLHGSRNSLPRGSREDIRLSSHNTLYRGSNANLQRGSQASLPRGRSVRDIETGLATEAPAAPPGPPARPAAPAVEPAPAPSRWKRITGHPWTARAMFLGASAVVGLYAAGTLIRTFQDLGKVGAPRVLIGLQLPWRTALEVFIPYLFYRYHQRLRALEQAAAPANGGR